MEEKQQQSWDENRLGWLGLAWFESFGAKTLRRLRTHYHDDGAQAFGISRNALLALGVSEKITSKFIDWRYKVDPAMLARRCEADQIRFILDDEDEFPTFLKHSSVSPAVLFLRGAFLKTTKPIAVVGTRAMTNYGARVTEDICRDLTLAGCEIISGLALGVDAKAHATALDMGGVTVAVLAGGGDDRSIYPRNNIQLAQRIIKNRGTILSEFPPGTESFKHYFPLRNRLIAGLCVATVVIEAAESSGSLITAKLALEENRDVFVVPGPITSEQSSGTNRLLQAGAIPCLGARDILSLFEFKAETPVQSINITEDERALLEILDRPIHIDELIRALEISPAIMTSRLSTMELNSLVEHQGAGVYCRTKLGRGSLNSPR